MKVTTPSITLVYIKQLLFSCLTYSYVDEIHLTNRLFKLYWPQLDWYKNIIGDLCMCMYTSVHRRPWITLLLCSFKIYSVVKRYYSDIVRQQSIICTNLYNRCCITMDNNSTQRQCLDSQLEVPPCSRKSRIHSGLLECWSPCLPGHCDTQIGIQRI